MNEPSFDFDDYLPGTLLRNGNLLYTAIDSGVRKRNWPHWQNGISIQFNRHPDVPEEEMKAVMDRMEASADLLAALEELLKDEMAGETNPACLDGEAVVPRPLTWGALRRARSAIAKAKGTP